MTFILGEGDITVRKTGERPFALRHRYDDAAADKYIEVTGISRVASHCATTVSIMILALRWES